MRKSGSGIWVTLLICILVLKFIWGLWMASYGNLHLAPDEAQYWVWSQYLDFGYYSKPPGIAWQIKMGTLLFGNTELGVRFVAICLSSLLSFAVYFLAKCCGLSTKTACFSAITIALCPIGLIASFAATTDGGFVLFWTLSLALLAKSLRDKIEPSYLLLGLFILCGALFKWTIFLMWALPLVGLIFYPAWRSKKIILGILISLIAFLPSIVWNSAHEWVTFKHVWTQSTGGNGAAPGNALEFFLAQFGIMSPLFFLFFVGAFFALIRKKSAMPEPLCFCTFIAWAILIAYTLLALKQKMQINWVVYIYPQAAVALSWVICELKSPNKWFCASTLLSCFLSVIALSVPWLQSNALFSQMKIPYSLNLFKHSLGWENLSPALVRAGYDPNEHFLVADRYQMSSILSFYGEDQKRAYFFNILGMRKNQFSFWTSFKQEQGKDGFFVIVENRPLEDASRIRAEYEVRLAPYFKEVHFEKMQPLFVSYGLPVKWALIFKVNHYDGNVPKDPLRY
ncbi:MAG: glycosyltransferase family 39 protein [Chlamydiales bacterium]|nr:glycosyltransferase family 39 protein [Chlamydiales bacterium]